MDLTLPALAFITGVFLFAGSVKGLIGVGLPTVAVALLVTAMPLRDAASLIVIPAVVTNIWQAWSGGHGWALVKRFWQFLLLVCVGTWIGAGILASADQRLMGGIFGAILSLYALIGLMRPIPPPPGRAELWLSPVLGFANGILNGLTGSYMIPSVLYLQALGLRREELIQGMGIMFLCASAALGLSLASHSVMHGDHALISAGALLPASIGYYAGERFRNRLNESLFRRVFLTGLLIMGVYMLITSIAF